MALAVLTVGAAGARADHGPSIVITQVQTDTAGAVLTIEGQGFGLDPRVTLAGVALAVVSATPSRIVATLPAGLAPGTYLLRVRRGHGHLSADFPIAIGLVGPPGPPGPTGPAGPQGPPGPARLTLLELAVDCSAGERLADALAQAEWHPGPVVITIHGTCRERAVITRSLALRAGSAGDGLEAPAGVSASVVNLASNSTLALLGLTIDGAGAAQGVFVSSGGRMHGSGITIRDTTSAVVVERDSTASLIESTIEASRSVGLSVRGALGADSVRVIGGGDSGSVALSVEGDADLRGCTLDGYNWGVSARHGARVTLWETDVTNHRTDGVMAESGAVVAMTRGRIAGNAGRAATLFRGGRLELGAVTVESNGSGVFAVEGSGLSLAGGTPPSQIRNNAGNGITLRDTSVVAGGGYEITGNTGWGISCEQVPSAAQVSRTLTGATVFGNTAGQIDCPGATAR